MSPALKTRCPNCSKVYNLKDRSLAGKKIKCRKCKKAFTVRPMDEVVEIEDYGVDEFQSFSAPPAFQQNPKGNKRRSRKRSSISWKIPILIVVVAVLLGGIGYGINWLSNNSVTGLFDTPEGLIDKENDLTFEMVDALEAIRSKDDIQTFLDTTDRLKAEMLDLNERLVAIGPFSDERVEEIIEYNNQVVEQNRERLSNRVESALERLKSQNLGSISIAMRVSSFSMESLDVGLAREIPEPRPDVSADRYHHDLVAAYREAAIVLMKMDDLSTAQGNLDQLSQAIASFDKLSELSQRERIDVKSPYFMVSAGWNIFLAQQANRVRGFAAESEAVIAKLDVLSVASQAARSNDSGMGSFGRRVGNITVLDFPGSSTEALQGADLLSGDDRAHQLKLDRINKAMFDYSFENSSYPGRDRDHEGHAGLSWRVYLTQNFRNPAVYRQFDLDSDWQSAKNQAMLAQRPDEYKSRFSTNDSDTTFHVFEGEGTPFGGDEPPDLRDLRDGRSGTIMIVEGGSETATEWTRPGGLPFVPENPRSALGTGDGQGHLVLMFDGSVRRISNKMDPASFAKLIRHQDSNPRAQQIAAGNAIPAQDFPGALPGIVKPWSKPPAELEPVLAAIPERTELQSGTPCQLQTKHGWTNARISKASNGNQVAIEYLTEEGLQQETVERSQLSIPRVWLNQLSRGGVSSERLPIEPTPWYRLETPTDENRFLDLDSVGNQGLSAPFGQNRRNTLLGLNEGIYNFRGTEFRLGSQVIHLNSALVRGFADSVKIPVNRKVKALAILQSAVHRGGDGTVIGEYRLDYEDGEPETIEMTYGVHLREMWSWDKSDTKQAELVWTGDNASTLGFNLRLRLYLFTLDNPKPDETVTHLIISSNKTTPIAPFFLAISAIE